MKAGLTLDLVLVRVAMLQSSSKDHSVEWITTFSFRGSANEVNQHCRSA